MADHHPLRNIIFDSPLATGHRIILLGGGGHAKVVADCLAASGRSVAGCLDDSENPALTSMSIPRLGSLNDFAALALRNPDFLIFAAIGDNALRMQLLAGTSNDRQAVVIHPSAVISYQANIEPGVLIAPSVVVNPDSVIEQGAILNTSCVIEHDCVIGAGSHIAPGAVLGGAVRIGQQVLVGIGARVLPGVTIGDNAIVGAGAVVAKNVAAGQRVKGIPAC